MFPCQQICCIVLNQESCHISCFIFQFHTLLFLFICIWFDENKEFNNVIWIYIQGVFSVLFCVDVGYYCLVVRPKQFSPLSIRRFMNNIFFMKTPLSYTLNDYEYDTFSRYLFWSTASTPPFFFLSNIMEILVPEVGSCRGNRWN